MWTFIRNIKQLNNVGNKEKNHMSRVKTENGKEKRICWKYNELSKWEAKPAPEDKESKIM